MKQTAYRQDLANKKIWVTREFAAPVNDVWQAWTDSSLLDQWWAPKPWKAETKSMDFRTGGSWLYCMVGPEGEKHWARADFNNIVVGKSYECTDAFCDEEGNINPEMPRMLWNIKFTPIEGGTMAEIEINFPSKEDLEKTIEMGFKEGFAAAHENLDELLSRKS